MTINDLNRSRGAKRRGQFSGWSASRGVDRRASAALIGAMLSVQFFTLFSGGCYPPPTDVGGSRSQAIVAPHRQAARRRTHHEPAPPSPKPAEVV